LKRVSASILLTKLCGELTKQLYPGIESKIFGALTRTGPLLCVSVTLVEAGKRHPLLRTTGARAFLDNPRITQLAQ
jgi:hypothetical protein